MAVHPEGMLLVYGIPHKECTHEALHAWYRVHSRTRLRWPGMISVDRLVSADGKDVSKVVSSATYKRCYVLLTLLADALRMGRSLVNLAAISFGHLSH